VRFADDRVDGGLGGLGLSAGQVPHAVGEAGALAQREQDLILPGEQQEHVEGASLRVSHGR
jgi:hypothetical protein